MHLYWRINQDLETLGEYIVFHDPSFIRCFKKWIEQNFTSLVLLHDENARISNPKANNENKGRAFKIR